MDNQFDAAVLILYSPFLLKVVQPTLLGTVVKPVAQASPTAQQQLSGAIVDSTTSLPDEFKANRSEKRTGR